MNLLHLEPLAIDDIREICAWYETQRPGLGLEFLGSLREVLQSIEASPLKYATVEGEVRYAMPKRFPYKVFFTTALPLINVHAVTHGARRPEYWRDRTSRDDE